MKPGPGCDKCPLYKEAGPVWGEGSPNAKLVVIGMAPAGEEILAEREDGTKGRPFVGPSGGILTRGLTQAGELRNNIYITNLVKCFVKPRSPVPALAISCCKPLLDRELESLQHADTILTLGATPFEALAGKRFTTVTSKKDTRAWLRGNPFPAGSKTIIPAAHPAYLMSTGFRDQPWWQKDVSKAVRISKEGVQSVEENFNYNPTEQELETFIEGVLTDGEFGLDIETSEKIMEEEGDLIGRGEADIQVIGLARRSGGVIGVPPPLFPSLQRLFNYTSGDVTCYVFNAGFDIFHLRRSFTFAPSVKIFDVMLGLNLLYSDMRPKDLGMALSIFTDLPYSKNLAKVDPQRYNAYDTLGVILAGINMSAELKRMGLWGLFWNHEMTMWPIVDELRTVGTQCDTQHAGKLELICQRGLQAYEDFWHKISPSINWTQNKEMLAIFLKQGMPPRFKMRVNSKDKSRKKTLCLDMEVLEEYRDRYKNQTAALILLMRQLKKASDFTHIYDSDGKAHVQYDIKAQKMGRLQAKDPDLQNIPEELILSGGYKIRPRTIITSDGPDDVIIAADFEQIEFWLYAFAAQDQPLLEAKRRGEYIYGMFYEDIRRAAPDLFKVPFFQTGMPKKKMYKNKEVKPSDLLIAKSGPLGLIYGRGEQSLILGFGISPDTARAIKNGFFNGHLAISSLHTRLLQEAGQHGYLRNYFGRIRRFPFVQTMRNEILAFPGQCNAADILRKNALLPLSRGLSDFGARLILTVHDSVAVSCPRRAVHGAVSFIRENMEAPLPELQNYWIPAEISVGSVETSSTAKANWGDTIPYDDWCIMERGQRDARREAVR